MQKKRILWVTPDFPFPPNHGGRMDIFQRIASVPRDEYEIDLVATVKAAPTAEDLAQARQHVAHVTVVPRDRRVAPMLRGIPYQAASRLALRDLPLSGSYDLVVLESEYVAPLLSNPHLKATGVVLRVHNNEQRYYAELAASTRSLPRKLYYAVESRLFAGYSPRVKRAVRELWHISSEEVVADGRHHLALHVPPCYRQRFHAGEHASAVADSHSVLFVGSLFMPNNLQGLQWYLAQVHPRLIAADPAYDLIVAGNCLGVPDAPLEVIERTPRVTLQRSPPSLDELYRRSAVFINPMLHGAGVKLKTLNAIEQGISVVATPTGAEGLGLRPDIDLAVAQDPIAFADAVLRLLKDRSHAAQLAGSAQSRLGGGPAFADVLLAALHRSKTEGQQ